MSNVKKSDGVQPELSKVSSSAPPQFAGNRAAEHHEHEHSAASDGSGGHPRSRVTEAAASRNSGRRV